MKKRTYEEMVAYIEGYNACFEKFCECFKGRKSLADAVAKMRKIMNEVNKIVETDEAERKENERNCKRDNKRRACRGE